jgi:predicted dehydrogenase
MLRVGLLGHGYWGEKLLRVFDAQPGVRVRAAADPDAARRAAVGGAPEVLTDGAALWNHPEVDAIVIATPPATHYALAREVLRAGKHCWVEKPLALRAAEARELVALAAQRQRTLFVDETFLYDPLVQRARAWIAAGRLGRVYHLSFQRLSLGRIRRDSDIWWNAAPHDLAILRYLVPAEVESIQLERFSYVQPGIADTCVATIRLAGNVSVHLYLSWLSPTKAGSVTVVGSAGMLHYEGRFGQRALTFYDYTVADPATVTANVVPIPRFAATETVAGGDEEPLALAAAAFVESARTGKPAPSDGRASLRVVDLLAAGDAHRAAAKARIDNPE